MLSSAKPRFGTWVKNELVENGFLKTGGEEWENPSKAPSNKRIGEKTVVTFSSID